MDFVSTRGGGEPVSFNEAFARGLAPDGGLYVPRHLPLLPQTILVEDALPYAALAWDFLSLFDSDHDSEHLVDIIDRSYGDFSDTMNAPLQQLADNLFVLELFHGPSLSFKDFGLQLIGSLFEEQIERTGVSINVLGRPRATPVPPRSMASPARRGPRSSFSTPKAASPSCRSAR
jgi:threonine synthase